MAGVTRAGAAWCVTGEYGAGLVGGDELDLDVAVDRGATLMISSQGSCKVYKSKQDKKRTKQRLRAAEALNISSGCGRFCSALILGIHS